MKASQLLVALILILFCHAPEAKIKVTRHASKEKIKDTRIVGGKPTSINNLKYLVNLRLRGRFICGGALISRRFVLTAAHCVKNVRPSQLRVQGGSTFLNRGGVIRQVKKIIIAPRYRTDSLNMDVAVLKLSTRMRGRNTKPIKLCSHRLRPGTAVRISGWGDTSETVSKPSNQVRTTIVRMISHSQCARKYGSDLQRSMICAELKGLRDSCTGDSGGPLVHNRQVCGIVSWGDGCARRNSPGVYTSVNAARSFIKRALKQ